VRGGRRADSQRRYRETWARWRATSDEAFAAAVSRCRFASDVLRELGFDLSGGNYAAVKRRLRRLGLDTSHWFKGRPPAGRPLAEVLVRGGYSSSGRYTLKGRLIKAGILRNECYECGQQPTWRGKPLVLVLDHINGVNDDYRRENLRLLCPNCNSQTPTFCGKNMKRRRLLEPAAGRHVRESPAIYAVWKLSDYSARRSRQLTLGALLPPKQLRHPRASATTSSAASTPDSEPGRRSPAAVRGVRCPLAAVRTRSSAGRIAATRFARMTKSHSGSSFFQPPA
jgi:5-methylcytosine-specific restriction endonuclease McrA